MSKMNRNHIYLIVWILLILYASLCSPDNIPKIELFAHADKVVHFLMYFGLSMLFLIACFKNRISFRNLFLSIVFSFSFGLIMEFFQYLLTTNRSASIHDVLFNFIGSTTGVLVYRFLIKGSEVEKVIFKN